MSADAAGKAGSLRGPCRVHFLRACQANDHFTGTHPQRPLRPIAHSQPTAQSLPIHSDVQCQRGMGNRADTDSLDTRFGDLPNGCQIDTP